MLQPRRQALVLPMHRRAFLRLVALATAGLTACDRKGDDTGATEPAAPACSEHDLTGEAPSGEAADLPHLGGAPDSPEGRAIAAFCDTVIPGRHRDDTGAPGAIDVGAPAAFFDPDLPAAPLVPLLVALLDAQAALVEAGATFALLVPEAREVALEGALTALATMEFAVRLVRLAYYSSAGAACHLGYPGPNPGYWDDPEFSFLDAQSVELTEGGNLG